MNQKEVTELKKRTVFLYLAVLATEALKEK